MICCLNPRCNLENPSCPDGTEHCTSCGKQLVLLFDRYRPVRRIGTGDAAVTYFAQDRQAFVNKDCVIKQLTIEDPKVRELAQREARRLAQVSKDTPHIPKLLDCRSEEEYLYLVQWFVEGQNLDKYLVRHGAFKEEEVIDFLDELLPVLDLVHRQKLVHRDLKLENIIRRNNGDLVLVDFGLHKQSVNNIAQSGHGTPGYAPSEQIERGITSPASDLYSLGAVCFHLLAGKHPFTAFQDRNYDWTNRWRRYLPKYVNKELGNIIDKLLKQHERDRYHSARDVLKDLNRFYRRGNSPGRRQASAPNSTIIGNVPPNSRSRVTENSYGNSSRNSYPESSPWGVNTLLMGGLVVATVAVAPKLYQKYQAIDPSRAMEDYTQAIQSNPDDPDGYAHRAEARLAMGDKKGAIEDYTRALNLNPDDADIYLHRGDLRAAVKNRKGAIEDYTRALNLNPQNADTYSHRGDARYNVGDKKGALNDYTQAIDLNADNADAYAHRGNARFATGDKKGAIEDYTQVIKLNPDRADAYFNRGNTKAAIGDTEGASYDLAKAIQLNPHYANVRQKVRISRQQSSL